MLFSSFLSLGQNYATRVYTTEDGLPFNDVFDIFQDSKGYLWIGTYGGGISRFDGRRFENFTMEDGLGSNSVYGINEDIKGGIWFRSDKNTTRFYKGCFTAYPYSNYGDSNIAFIFQENTNNIILHDRKHVFLFNYDLQEFILDSSFPPITNDSLTFYTFDPYSERIYFIKKKSENEWQQIFVSFGQDLIPIPNPPDSLFKMNSTIGLFFLPNGKFITRVPQDPNSSVINLFLYDGQSWSPLINTGHDFTLGNHEVNLDGKGNLYINQNLGNQQYEILEFGEDFSTFKKIKLNSPFLARRVIKDNSGCFWVTSVNGLIRISPWFLSIYHTTSNMVGYVDAIAEDRDGKIWFGSYGNGFAYYHNNSIQPAPDFLNSASRILPGSIINEKGNMLFSVEVGEKFRGVLEFDGNNLYKHHLANTPGFFFYKDHLDRIIYGASRKGIFIHDQNLDCEKSDCWENMNIEDGLEIIHVHAIAEDTINHRLWMGQYSTGISFWDQQQDSIHNFLVKNSNEDFGARSIVLDHKNNMWFGTDKGLQFCRNRKNIGETFDPRKDFQNVANSVLGDGIIYSLKIYKEKYLIIGTATGFGFFDLESFYKRGKTHIRFFSKENGFDLGGCRQNSIWIDREENIWIGADNGAIRFNPRLLPQIDYTPSLKLDSLSIDGEYFYPDSSPLIIRKKESINDLKVWQNLEHPSPTLSKTEIFQLLLYSNSDTIINQFSKDLYFEFSKMRLTPGRYMLEIYADFAGNKSGPISIPIVVNRYFYKSLWFWALFILSIASAFIIYYQRILKMEKDKDQLKVQAVLNQLNPHFLKNTLQWMQSKIFNEYDGEKEMISVIGKLGQNISVIFKNSKNKQSFHTLEEEMNLVRNYLYIQKIRYGDKLSFELPNPWQFQSWTAIKVPLMTLQIHTENAIEHGIRNKQDGVGRVKIKFSEEDDYLFLKIEDDGVGRTKAKELRSRGTQRGVKMLAELMRIYNKQNEFKFSQEYTDEIHYSGQGNRFGTRVTIQIPKQYKYEL